MAEQSSFMRFATQGERKIARALIAAALDRGHNISVEDGEEITVTRSTNARQIADALATTDHDRLLVFNADGRRVATFLLIWGNAEDGEELIADYGGATEADTIYRAVIPAP